MAGTLGISDNTCFAARRFCARNKSIVQANLKSNIFMCDYRTPTWAHAAGLTWVGPVVTGGGGADHREHLHCVSELSRHGRD